jgi:hypothetical protein
VSTAKRVRAMAAAVALVLAHAGTASADTHLIRPDGLGDFPTIQAAVDAAADGDTVLLTNGYFRGDGNRDIEVPARPITIASQTGDYLECIVDCEGSARDQHRGFHFTTAVGTGDALLQGVGIINGFVYDGGGGIWVEGANTHLEDCAIVGCTVENTNGKGGGLRVSDGGAPNVYNCLFSLNTAGQGGGVAIDNAYGTFNHCDVVDNTATDTGGGLYIYASGTFQIGYSDILSNQAPRGGGVRIAGVTSYIQQCVINRNDATDGHAGGVLLQGGVLRWCTIVDNSATEGAGGVHCHAGTGDIIECIIAFSESGYGVGATDGYAPSLECCDVYGNPAGEYDSVVGNQTGIDGNFSLDPEFCNWTLADYWLFDTSPCAYGNNDCDHQVGALGVNCDSPVEEMSWGRVKAMWR